MICKYLFYQWCGLILFYFYPSALQCKFKIIIKVYILHVPCSVLRGRANMHNLISQFGLGAHRALPRLETLRTPRRLVRLSRAAELWCGWAAGSAPCKRRGQGQAEPLCGLPEGLALPCGPHGIRFPQQGKCSNLCAVLLPWGAQGHYWELVT